MFEVIFDRVITHEAGFQNEHSDRGNWTGGQVGAGELKGTKYGISAMTYPHLDIENLTLEEAKGIYWEDWFIEYGIVNYSTAMQYQLFDAAINSGMYNANRMMQRALGVKDDGIIGVRTRSAMAAADPNDLLMCFLAERLVFMSKLTSWRDFGKGWARRIAANLKYAAEDN